MDVYYFLSAFFRRSVGGLCAQPSLLSIFLMFSNSAGVFSFMEHECILFLSVFFRRSVGGLCARPSLLSIYLMFSRSLKYLFDVFKECECPWRLDVSFSYKEYESSL